MEEPTKVNSTASFGVTSLGLAIARKQLEGGDDLDKKKKSKPKQQKTTTTTSWTKTTVDGKKKNASWMALVEGVTLYATCLVLPSLIGMILNLEARQQMWQDLQRKVCERSAWACWHVFGAMLPAEPEQPEPLTFAKNFAPDTYVSDIYVIVLLTLGMALFRVLLVHMLVPNNLAPQQMEALVRCKSMHLLSSNYKESLTPRPETPRNVISLESFNKEFGGPNKKLPPLPPLPPFPAEKTPERLRKESLPGFQAMENTNKDDNKERLEHTSLSRRRPSANDLGLSIDDTPIQTRKPTIELEGMPPMAQIGGFLQACGPRDGQDDNDSNQHLLVDDSAHDFIQEPLSSPFTPQQQEETPSSLITPTHSPLPYLERSQSAAKMEGEEGETEGGGWKRRGSTASFAAAAAAALQEEEEDLDEDHHPHDAAEPVARPQRLFAAPRYATAVFRLLYCSLACAMAWYLFRDADFWPSYVGGHGSTTHCWDLSGSLALAKNLDSDFDHRNTVLRRFFLVQASYHLHSGAFHVFSVLLLHFLKKDEDGKDDKSKKGWLSLLGSLIHPRAMLQHSLSLLFLIVSYVFSSLRRLGAIAMFALDTSSWALHLLQTCLNAPTDSVLSNPKVIKGVWALVVLPSFLYFRFWVWPMVGYSAMVESEQWLAQLESTLVPGSALWFRRTFQLWMTLWMGFHVIHFKRLVFHPHIQRITGKEQRTLEESAVEERLRSYNEEMAYDEHSLHSRVSHHVAEDNNTLGGSRTAVSHHTLGTTVSRHTK